MHCGIDLRINALRDKRELALMDTSLENYVAVKNPKYDRVKKSGLVSYGRCNPRKAASNIG